MCVFTHVSDVLSDSLSPEQRGDPEAVVPVAAAEEKLSIVRDHKQPGCDLQPGGEGSGEEALRPGGRGREEDEEMERGRGREEDESIVTTGG